MAFHAIKAGEGDAYISAGVEMVSRFMSGNSDSLPGTQNPYFDDAQARSAKAAEGGQDGWTDPRENGQVPDVYISMGQTAENLARIKGVSREEMDEFAARSQNLAEKAIANGFWEREITPVTLPDGTVVSADDGPRPGVTVEGMAGLKPVFRPDGLITAGNACPLNDGAAAVIIMSSTKAKELGLTPLARILSTSVTGLSPEIMGYGPKEAIEIALARAGKSVADIDLFEINEAFAAQVIPSYKDAGIPIDKLNVHGGAIAVGHPFGMTGARITGTLLNGLQSQDKTFGVESMCVGGGMGMAMVLERLELVRDVRRPSRAGDRHAARRASSEAGTSSPSRSRRWASRCATAASARSAGGAVRTRSSAVTASWSGRASGLSRTGSGSAVSPAAMTKA